MPKTHWRLYVVSFFFSAATAGLLWRLIDLNILKRSFLLKQSKARILRVINIPAHRGIITDRLNSPLAISVPVSSIWSNPSLFQPTQTQANKLAQLLKLSPQIIQARLKKEPNHQFVYLKRDCPLPISKKIKALQIPGVFFEETYHRFYPEGNIMAHVLGFTNVDDQGQEGIELAYNQWLAGMPGKKEITQDRLGNIVANLVILKKPLEGQPLILSIDHRIQYLAYQELQKIIDTYHAKSGSVIVLKVKTGEILSMVNLPSYNPNQRPSHNHGQYRNRAMTDRYEPGSVMKPFLIALALESKQYTSQTEIDTNPGWMTIDGYTIRDHRNFGVITLTTLLKKSSNIAAAKLLFSLSPKPYRHLLHRLGFGQQTTTAFPGEPTGKLTNHYTWKPSETATLSYGYGIDITLIQLAHAYATLANDGIKVPITFIKRKEAPIGEQVLKKSTTHTLINMLKTVIEKGGTGTLAAIPRYQIAGKTGTAYITGKHGYEKYHYMSSFAGIAPASNPQFVVAVVIQDPHKDGHHYGGIVAAGLFKQVMSGTLNLFNIPPDNFNPLDEKP